MKYRMYSFVLKQLNPIQKGVQTAHAVVEYATAYHNTNEYQRWSKLDKTLIMLDGGTYPEMMELLETLKSNGIKYEYFEEEDLNHLVTAITVIADERVWDKENYPDYDVMKDSWMEYDEWLESIGGDSNADLRDIIFSKRLAN
jgi:hypothetical protein